MFQEKWWSSEQSPVGRILNLYQDCAHCSSAGVSEPGRVTSLCVNPLLHNERWTSHVVHRVLDVCHKGSRSSDDAHYGHLWTHRQKKTRRHSISRTQHALKEPGVLLDTSNLLTNLSPTKWWQLLAYLVNSLKLSKPEFSVLDPDQDASLRWLRFWTLFNLFLTGLFISEHLQSLIRCKFQKYIFIQIKSSYSCV